MSDTGSVRLGMMVAVMLRIGLGVSLLNGGLLGYLAARRGGSASGLSWTTLLGPAAVLQRAGQREQDRHGGHDHPDAAGIHALLGGHHEQVERRQSACGQERQVHKLPRRRPPDPLGGGQARRGADRVAQRLAAGLRVVAQGVEDGEGGADDRHAGRGAGDVCR